MSRRSGWFLEITLDSSTLRWWSGELDITFGSETYTGLGTRWITPEEIKRSASLKSEKIELQFDSSRQTDNTDAIGALLDAKWRRRAVRLRRIAWDWGVTPDDGDVLVDEYGRIQNVSDIIVKDEQPTLSMEIESGSLAYLERRMVTRSSASQKAVFAGDKGFDLAVQLAGTSVAWRTKEKKEGTVKKTWPEGDPAPRHLIIGECVVEGSFVAHFANGQQNKYYQTIYAIADHKLTELNGIYMNGELVYNGVLSHGVKTEVTKWRSGGARCWVTYYDGRDDQTADSYLVSAETNWTTDHRLRGLAYCIIEHLYDDDNPLDYNYGFRVKGAALYDRRLDTTAGGSGSQRWNDPDTWTYTANAMVAIDHYRMGRIVVSGSDQMWFGIGEAADNIPYAEFEELADLCDEDVTLSGGGTHKRYEVNGQIPSDKSHKDVFEMLAAQMAAEAIDQGGRLSIRPPVTRTSVITLTDDDLLYESESEANPGGRIDDMVNTLVGKFRDAQNDYKFNEYPKVTNATYVEDDNGEISDSFDLDLETDAERAQRLATLKIGLSRRIFELEETYIAKARVIAPGEWFTRTSASRGFTGKLFIADEVIRHFDGSVTVRSVEVDPDDLVWDENNAASIDAPPAFPSISLPGLDAPTVAVTAFEESGNGAAYPAFLFEFTQPADLTDILADYYEVEYGVSASGGGIDGTAKRQLIDAQIDAIEAVGFLPSTEYAFRFRARLGSRIGDWGSWIYETSTANSTSTDAGEVSWSNVTDDGGKPDDNADVTSANVASGFTGQTDWATDDTPVEALTRPAPNLIPDAGFRFGGKGWALSGGATTSLTDAGGVLSHALSDGTRVSTVDVQGIEAGASYTLSAEFAAAYTSGSVYCDVIWLNDALETVLDDGGVIATKNAVYTGPKHATLTAPTGATKATVRFVTENILVATRLDVRRIKLAKCAYQTPWSDEATRTAAYGDDTNIDDLQPAEAGSDVTGSNVSSGFTGQGALATEDTLAYGSGFLTNFGAMAGNNFASFGVNVRLEDGTTVVTDNAVVTASGVASGFSGQTAWATFSASTDRVQYLSDAGLLDSLSRISTRPLSLLSGRTADYITYTGGATVESLEPAEAGSDVTGSNVSSGFSGQGALATEDTVGLDSALVSGLLPVTSAADGLVNAAIQLGGVNMLTKANWSAGNFEGGASFVTSGVANGRSGWGIQLVRSAGSTPVASSVLKAWPSGEDLTLSFIAWTLSAGATLVADLFPDTLPEQSFSVSTTPTLFKWEGLSSSHADMVSASGRFFNASGGDETIIITDIKWERGNKATFWSPAPEDVEALRLAGYTGDLSADVTSENNSAGFAGQTAWATYSGSTDRVQYLSDTGLLDSLTRISSRPLSALSGRTADQITYTSAGATVDSLEPQETGANVTEDRVASAFSGQGALATEDDLTLGGGYLLGFGDLAANNFARFGLDVRLEDGATLATDSALVTASGVASGITGQTDWATEATPVEALTQPAPNLVPDGGFRFGAKGWTLTAGATTTLTDEGGLLSHPLSDGTRVSQVVIDGIAAGEAYILSAEFAATYSTGAVQCDVVWLDGANATVLDDEGITATQNAVFAGPKHATLTAPTGAEKALVRFVTASMTGATRLDVRRIKLAKSAYTSPFSDEATRTAAYGDDTNIDDLQPSEAGSDVTGANVSSGFTGQGALATEDDIALDSGFLTGLLPTNRAASGLVNTNISIASNGSLSGGGGGQVTFDGLGGGDVGVLDSISLGSTYLRREDGTTQLTDNLVVTSVGTASGFSGQGALATLNALAYGDAELTGFGSLATLTQIALGSTYIKREDGTTTVTDTLVITTLGVASGFSGQGDLATANMTYGGSAPSSPSNGDFWADTAEGALKFRNAGTWETIADISPTGAFTASYSGDPVNDSGTATDFTTSSISINTSGGTGPYLYLTEIISANVLVPKTSVTLPNSSSFQLSAEGFSVSENEKGIIRTTVVDETTGNSATIIKPWSMTRTS